MRCASDVVGVERERTLGGDARLFAFVLSRVQRGALGQQFGGVRIELLRALERGDGALGVAVGFEPAREHELVVRLRGNRGSGCAAGGAGVWAAAGRPVKSRATATQAGVTRIR